MTIEQHYVLQTLLAAIKTKNSWGKNELIELIAQIAVESIDIRSIPK